MTKYAKPNHNLAVLYPEVANEWHPTLNGDVRPEHVLPTINRKFWWLCKHGHEWEARVGDRAVRGRGCPFCSGRYATTENNLQNTNPQVASQWNANRNGELKPVDVLPTSRKKVWWVCEKGHEWQQEVGQRLRDKRPCPVCVSLPVKNKVVAEQWHPSKNGSLKPEDFTYGSDKKVWWRCQYGHEWVASISHRCINDSGCPLCTVKSSDLEIRIYTELKKIFTEVRWRSKVNGNEIDVYVEDLKLAIEIDGHYWHKNRVEKDASKEAVLKSLGIKLIRLRETPLKLRQPFDINYSVKDDELVVIKRLLVSTKKLYGLKNNKVDEYMGLGHYLNDQEFKQLAASLPQPEWDQSFEVKFPQYASQWNYERNFPLTPSMFSPFSNKKIWWKCEQGHEWKTSINHRTGKSIGCPFCSGRYATESDNLSAKFPDVAKQWHPLKNGTLTPDNVRPQSNKKVWWMCEKGHEWEAVIGSRIRNGCPYCSGRKASNEFNLAVIHPEVAADWDYAKNGQLTPRMVIPGGTKEVWWKCKAGHERKSVIRDRVRSKVCPICKKDQKTP